LTKSEYEKREYETRKLGRTCKLQKREREGLRGCGVEAAFDKSEGNGGICDEEIGKEARGKMGLMSVFGMRG
jgi:hypothetical protein